MYVDCGIFLGGIKEQRGRVGRDIWHSPLLWEGAQTFNWHTSQQKLWGDFRV